MDELSLEALAVDNGTSTRPFKLRWEDAVFDDPGLTATQTLVGLAVAWYARAEDGHNAFPSVETITRRTKLSRRTVQTTLRQLRELGYLRDVTPPEQRRQQHRRGLANVYHLTFPTGATDDANGCNWRPATVRQLHPNTHRTPIENTQGKSIADAMHPADARRQEDTRTFDPRQDDPMQWLDVSADGFQAGEEAMSMDMIDRGVHPYNVLNVIHKQRAG